MTTYIALTNYLEGLVVRHQIDGIGDLTRQQKAVILNRIAEDADNIMLSEMLEGIDRSAMQSLTRFLFNLNAKTVFEAQVELTDLMFTSVKPMLEKELEKILQEHRPSRSDEEEQRYFDGLERARDMRAA